MSRVLRIVSDELNGPFNFLVSCLIAKVRGDHFAKVPFFFEFQDARTNLAPAVIAAVNLKITMCDTCHPDVISTPRTGSKGTFNTLA